MLSEEKEISQNLHLQLKGQELANLAEVMFELEQSIMDFTEFVSAIQ